VNRTAIINVVGLTPRHLGENTPNMMDFARRRPNRMVHVEPVLPAVTSTAQATYLTGKRPSAHGIVANGWYDRDYAEHRFWKQSNHLVQGRKLWEHLREEKPGFTCAKLFWWNNMYSSADWSVTPRPIYCANGKKVFDIATNPLDLRKTLRKKHGAFPFQTFWGPMSGIESSHWIARVSKTIEELYSPDLSLVYLPHLDYNLQRIGPNDPYISIDLGRIDAVVGDLIRFYENRGVQVALLSEYGITEVDHPIHLNRIFRAKGWLAIKDELGRDVLDLGASKAFAIADHQIAHIYVNDPSIQNEVRRTVEETTGVATVIEGSMRRYHGLEHSRSGDLIAVSNIRSWFTYYYWEKDRRAPDFARTVDIHRKPGYDPCELFFDPAKKSGLKFRLGFKALKSAFGMRTLFDVVPLDTSLVKGSHGCIPERKDNWPVLIGNFPSLPEGTSITAPDVYEQLHGLCKREA